MDEKCEYEVNEYGVPEGQGMNSDTISRWMERKIVLLDVTVLSARRTRRGERDKPSKVEVGEKEKIKGERVKRYQRGGGREGGARGNGSQVWGVSRINRGGGGFFSWCFVFPRSRCLELLVLRKLHECMAKMIRGQRWGPKMIAGASNKGVICEVNGIITIKFELGRLMTMYQSTLGGGVR